MGNGAADDAMPVSVGAAFAVKTALALSPHFDDAAFSCGGLLAVLRDQGWRTVVATVFTQRVPDPQGFALACQSDKGLGPEVDYMALRQAEDLDAMAYLDAEWRWLDFPEAPHRGYESAAALFGDVRADDDVWATITPVIAHLLAELSPDLVLSPSGMGGHVDHRQVIRAALSVVPPERHVFYRDTPYAIRNPAGPRHVNVPELAAAHIDIAAGLERKVSAATAYVSQLGFQFGGPGPAGQALREFAWAEGGSFPAEIVYAPSGHVPGFGLQRATL